MTPRAVTVLGARLRVRLPRPSDDSGNIAMLLMAILVGATIGTLLLATIITQNSATRFDGSRVRSLDAAQAGIDVMLGQLRNSTSVGTDGTTAGNSDNLPCVPITGPADASGTLTYNVSVSYFTSDPVKGATAMTCTSGYGPYDAKTGAHTPRYAKITSLGLDSSKSSSASKGRTLTTSYIFQTDDVNIPGGQIQLYPDSSGNKWCMDAGSGTAGVGAAVVLRSCSVALPAPPQQVWAYRSDLSIQLVSSVTAAQPTGLCLDTTPTAHAAGDTIVVNACNAVGTAAYNQKWSINDNAHLEGTRSDLLTLLPNQSGKDGYCITAAAQISMQALTLSGCQGSTNDTAQTWVPSATAGAGADGATLRQIINYQRFATCIDVPGGDPNAGYLILYSCKQDPVPSTLRWNQIFVQALGPPSPTALPQKGKLSMVDTETPYVGQTFCLTDPAALNGYVTMSTACTDTWTWNQTRDVNGLALPYAKVYTITDSAGRCLAPGTPSDTYLGQYFKIIVTTCSGGTDQKWNADPSVLASRMTATGEK